MNKTLTNERIEELAQLNLGYDRQVRLRDFARAIEREVLATQQPEPRSSLTDDQRDKIERAEACLRGRGPEEVEAANGLLDVLTAHPVQPEPRDAIVRSKRILALVDEYHESPTRDKRTALRVALMDEFQPEPRDEVTDGQIAAMFERVTGYSLENGRAALNDADILGFARELLETALTRSKP